MHCMFIVLDFSESNCVWAGCLPLHVQGDTGGKWRPRPFSCGLWALSEPVVTLHVNEPNQLRKCGPSTVGWLSAW